MIHEATIILLYLDDLLYCTESIVNCELVLDHLGFGSYFFIGFLLLPDDLMAYGYLTLLYQMFLTLLFCLL